MIKVFKIGGNVVDNEAALTKFCADFAAVDGPKVLIHGGGVMASSVQKALGQEPVKIEGRRVTDEATLKVVTGVYSGWCNKHIVSLLQERGCDALGLSGCDASVVKAQKRPPRTLMDGVTVVDYGFVGDVSGDSVNVPRLNAFLEMGLTPVLCAINHDGQGQLLNTNADTVACSVAAALGAELVCCFEFDGVLADRDDPSSVIPEVSADDFERMKKDGTISDGMIPKIENCLKALRGGAVGTVIKNASRICDGSGTRVKL